MSGFTAIDLGKLPAPDVIGPAEAAHCPADAQEITMAGRDV